MNRAEVLLAAIDTSEHRDCGMCGAAARIVHRYLNAVQEAQNAAQLNAPVLLAERKVAVLADVLDDLAYAYGITR